MLLIRRQTNFRKGIFMMALDRQILTVMSHGSGVIARLISPPCSSAAFSPWLFIIQLADCLREIQDSLECETRHIYMYESRYNNARQQEGQTSSN